MLTVLALIFAAYIIGSLPTGYWVVKALKGVDIRELGSKSTGATNVWRCVGKGPGIFVFVMDVLKGLLPVVGIAWLEAGPMAGQWQFLPPSMVPALASVAALVGHSKSPFLGFSGGKSAATGLGTLLALCPLGGVLTFLTWLCIVWLGRIVSIASILAVMLCGLYFWLLHAPWPYVAYCVFGFIYVTYRHKSNIQRMMNGTEPRIGEKPKAGAT